MTPTEKLDKVLSIFSDNPKHLKTTELQNILIDTWPAKREELIMIIDKLRKDDYVIMISPDQFQISFEGDLLIKSGGYAKKYADDERENIRLTALESFQHEYNVAQRKQATTLNWLTFWVAVGTLIAAVYYLTELYWKYHWFH